MEGEYGSDRVTWFDQHSSGALETPEIVAREQWYGVNSWPYARIDGSRVYNTMPPSCAQAAHDEGVLVAARFAETGNESPVEIAGSFLVGDATAWIEVVFRQLDPADLSGTQATFAVVEDGVAQGPVTFRRVARRIFSEPISLGGTGDSASFSIPIPLGGDWNTDHLWAVAWLQRTGGSKEIIQGALLPWPLSGAGEAAVPVTAVPGIDAVRPNPCAGEAEIVLTLPPGTAGRTRLEVFDPAGRVVARLAEGDLPAGTHRYRWVADAEAEGRLENGVYLVRLQTPRGTSSRKLILLR